uniref:Uncharacterized protein n=1 Tax=Acrobeloides nanus TaxID=290746 RepID=A0A914C879_9BILA
MKMYFLDDVLLEIFRSLVKSCGQRLHIDKLMFIPQLPCNNLKIFNELIRPFFKNLSEILSNLIFVDVIYIDLAPKEIQFLMENFPIEEFNQKYDTNLYISIRNSGMTYELNEVVVKKLLSGYKIFNRLSTSLNLHRMECENFCEIYLKIFKEANNPENFIKLIQLDGTFVKNFEKQIKFFEGVLKIKPKDEDDSSDDEEFDNENEEEDDENETEKFYVLSRPDFWALKIKLEIEKVEPWFDYFYEERSLLHTDPNIFDTRDWTWWEIMENIEIISWQQAKKRDIKRKRGKDWEKQYNRRHSMHRWLQHRSDGILEVRTEPVENQQNTFIVTRATFEMYFDDEGYKNSHEK